MPTSPSPQDPPSSSPGPSAPSQASPGSQPPSLLDAFSTISPLSDLQRLPSVPCARYSLMFGILAGSSVGALRFIFAARRGAAARGWGEAANAANWAVGTWGVGSLGAWETCRRRQSSEAARMQHLVNEVKAKRAAKMANAAGKKTAPSDAGPPAVVAAPRSRPLAPVPEQAESSSGGQESGPGPKKAGGWWPFSRA